ncbi:MAG: flagellar hook-basal body complex protein [Planctomycetota bacterium]
MASTTALFSGLSGLLANARKLDVVGNNISNVNTVGFKQSRLSFQSAFAQTFREGTAPNGAIGGTNPGQIGLGVQIAGTQRDFTPGALTQTGDARDLAIDGEGFFVVQKDGENLYTRMGGFRPDSNGDLTLIGGERLMGYGIDANFNIQQGALQPINLPIGQLRIAEATTTTTMSGNLDAGGDVATGGSQSRLLGSPGNGMVTISTSGTPTLGPTTLLVDLEDPNLAGTDTPLFADGQTLRFRNIEVGGRNVPEFTLAITGTTTLADLQTAINNNLGIHSTTTANPDGQFPGVNIDAATGIITVVSNTGTANGIEIDAADIELLDSGGLVLRNPFVTDNPVEATGESARTTMVVYDSLGSLVEVDVTFTMTAKTTGTTWRIDIASRDNAGQPGPFLQTQTVQFDSLGNLQTTAPIAVAVSRTGTGATTPLGFELNLGGAQGQFTALNGQRSEFAATFRDGLPEGVLDRYAVTLDGTVVGGFDNGAVRDLGQIVLGKFTNPAGLNDVGGGLFDVGANSGPVTEVIGGGFAAGEVVSGSLELSNVDLGQEFIDLILTSTGYSAASRVIRTADELMQQLLVLAR